MELTVIIQITSFLMHYKKSNADKMNNYDKFR